MLVLQGEGRSLHYIGLLWHKPYRREELVVDKTLSQWFVYNLYNTCHTSDGSHFGSNVVDIVVNCRDVDKRVTGVDNETENVDSVEPAVTAHQ